MRLRLNDLETFAAVGRHLSFTRAAAELGISQARVSAVIKGLEQQLGVALLHRSSRNVRLSLAGTEMLAHAQEVLSALDRAAECAAGWRSRQFGSIRIGAPLSTALIPARREMIERFQMARPDVTMTIVNELTGPLLDMLGEGAIDIAITFGEWQRPGIESHRVATARGYLIVSEGDPLAALDVVTADRLKGRAVAVFPRSIGVLHDPLYEPFRQAGCSLVEAPEPAMSSLISFGRRNRLPTVIHLWEPSELAAYPDAVPLAERAFDSVLTIFKRTDVTRGTTAKFWALATGRAEAAL
ncbi:LysR family transcriptional regulator [Sphingobium sp. Sx8-8]|uniref:LysR family transcriptional regulator n=1 Tax=Sphingobium sp. Sx8-8 TaxID=2933617 RepID=UPI001F589588|nr:LysR family transcriptional regulator [Sphingobium sp. Sx8-8]